MRYELPASFGRNVVFSTGSQYAAERSVFSYSVEYLDQTRDHYERDRECEYEYQYDYDYQHEDEDASKPPNKTTARRARLPS